jgi:predicted ATP-grasp superfamily ATP-dependent carboligase
MPPRPPVVLFGSDCLTGLQIARILWRLGVAVTGVADRPASAYCRTRALRRVATTRDAGELVALLDALKAEHGCPALLLPCTDRFAAWLSGHRDELEGRAVLLWPPADTLDLLADKARFYRWAQEGGFRLPETRVVESLEAIERAAQEMSFPLVIKPPRRTPAWDLESGAAKVCRVDDPEALMQQAPNLLSAAGPLILQAWVRGPDSLGRELVFCMDGGGELIASVVLQKIRQWPPGVGTGSLAAEMTDESVRAAGLALLEKVGYAGLGQIEFKRDAVDGELYLIEMNPGRPALNQPLCEAAGVEMTHAWYCAAAGLPRPAALSVTRPGAKWICWKRDLRAAYRGWRSGALSLADWGRSLRGIGWSADVQIDDLLPLLADAFQRFVRWARPGAKARTGDV